MKNNDERKAYIRNDENWKVIDLGHYTVTKLMKYKGFEFLKVEIVVEREEWWDKDRKTPYHHFVKALDLKGLFTVNEDGDALCYTTETNIIQKMLELDKKYPDKGGMAAVPPTIDIPRKGTGPW